MSVSRAQILTTAAREIGYVEGGGRDGRSGNITKFWAARYPAWQGQPWCGAFVDWVLAQHAADGYPIGRNGIFYTPSIVNAARAKGVWRSDSTSSLAKVRPGDIVLFDFNGSGNAQHVGFAEKYLGNGLVQTIEGNTSPTNVGSQNNGGGVYRRQRSRASIMGYVDMNAHYAGTSTAGPVAGARLSTKQIQQLLGVTADGDYGPATTKAVTDLQKALTLTADGQWGPITEGAVMSLQDDINTLTKKVDIVAAKTDQVPANVWSERFAHPGGGEGTISAATLLRYRASSTDVRALTATVRAIASDTSDPAAIGHAIADSIRADVVAAINDAGSSAVAEDVVSLLAERLTGTEE